MADETEVNAPVFHDVVFCIIPSEDLSPSKADNLIDLVLAYGGQHVPVREQNPLIEDLSLLTHIVSTHIDFPQYSAALENGIHIVTPSWIIRSADKQKQAQIRQHSPDPSQYFRDVVLTCADLPDGDKDAIIAGVITLGGAYSSSLSKLVTHIVTSSMDHAKCSMAVERKMSCKIVLPNWFDDCFKLGRMINERPYNFPEPELLRLNTTARVRDIHSSHLDGATIASPTGTPPSSPPSSPTEARKNLNAFMSRNVFLAEDLQLSKSLREILSGLIYHGGGTVTTVVEDCDIFIGQFRDGKDYISASRAGKTVANLSWLYHVINRNKYSDPLAKLLHYPVPRNGIPGFENMRISISNYTGDARLYLENLIRYCGAEFTKTMKQDNTHLITAHTQSEKCDAAREWNINIVNHIWLEECYAKASVQALTNPRYGHFPARTNLGEVAGQTRFDVKRLEQAYYPKSKELPRQPLQTPLVTANSKQSPRKTVSSTLALTSDAVGNQDSMTAVPGEDGSTDDEQPQTTTKRTRGRPPKSATTPRFRDDEKENQSPSLLSTDRKAKMKAADLLHNQADDIALFQKEMKRKGGVTHGGQRRSSVADVGDLSSPVPSASKQRKKRKSDEATYDVTAEGSDLSDGETQHVAAKPAKRAKNAAAAPAPLPPIRFRLMASGVPRWLNNRHREDADRQKLRQMGVQLTLESGDIGILVAPRLLRTRKFVCALASAPRVVHSSFLDAALEEGKLNEDEPLLYDEEGERRLGINLAESLDRARVNDRKLLRGWTIFVTENVNGGFETYKDIISVNGGACMLYRGRTGLTIPKRRLRPEEDEDAGLESQNQGGDEELDYVYLVSGVTEAEARLWKTFRALAEKQGLRARIASTDWLLHAAMSQQIEWRHGWELTEESIVK